MDEDSKFMKRPEEEVVLEEVEGIALDPGPGLALDLGLVPEEEDPGLDLIQEVALNLDPTQEIALNQDLLGTQEEIDLDQHQDLRIMIEKRMEIDPHPGREMLQGPVQDLDLVPGLDQEVTNTSIGSHFVNRNLLSLSVGY